MSDQLKQFGHVCGFELKFRLRQPAFYVFSALFFFLTFMATSTDSVQIGGGIGNVARNAPYIIAKTINAMGLFTVILMAIFMSTVVSRDKDLGVREILYSTPLRKFPLLMGRFTATIILAVIKRLLCRPGPSAGQPHAIPDRRAHSGLQRAALPVHDGLSRAAQLPAGRIALLLGLHSHRPGHGHLCGDDRLLRPVRLRLRVPGRPAEREPGRAAGPLRLGFPGSADPLLDHRRTEHPAAAHDRRGIAEPGAVVGSERTVAGGRLHSVPYGFGLRQGERLRHSIHGFRPAPRFGVPRTPQAAPFRIWPPPSTSEPPSVNGSP